MAKRNTIGNNPLDNLIAPKNNPVEDKQEVKHEITKLPMQRFTSKLPFDLMDRARNAVYWTPGLTLAKLTADAFSKELDRLEEGRGEPFPQRPEELTPGRPVT